MNLEKQGQGLIDLGLKYVEEMKAWNDIMNIVIPDQPMPEAWSTENFDAWEFRCPDCKQEHMNSRFIIRLQLSRRIAGIPYVIGSGWRCITRNALVGGVSDSSHMRGLAADIIATTSQEKFIIIPALLQAGFRRIGVAKYYIHVDSDPKKSQDIIYTYKYTYKAA